MPSAERAIDRADRLTRRQLTNAGEEFRERRLTLGISQARVAAACRMSRNHYGQIERGTCPDAALRDLDRIAVVLGLAPSVRFFPDATTLRDAGQGRRLQSLLIHVRPPLRHREEVALPQSTDFPERRAWDSVLLNHGERTAIELEMRLRDVQAMRRRIELKRRDDPTHHFLLLIADTRHNRRVLAEFAELFAELPRLRPSVVRRALEAGRHPPTGLLLV